MMSVMRFAAQSLLPGQILWTALDMMRLSRPLKYGLRCRMLTSVEQACVRSERLLPPDVFEPYRRLFKANHYDDRGTWSFNGTAFSVGEDFLFAPMDKSDYTFRMIFLHFEWLFQSSPFEARRRFNAMHKMLVRSPMYYHPSCLAQRSFVLAWITSQCVAEDDNFLIRTALKKLIVNTEDAVGANHRIDNYLAIGLLAYLVGLDKIVNWALQRLERSCNHWIAKGYYPEKTPCYQMLVAGRVRLLRHALSRHAPEAIDYSQAVAFLDRMAEVLDACPDVHLNDSYLPLANWRRSSVLRNCSYAWSERMGASSHIATVVIDGLADRGYRGHQHDASGAIFLHDENGRQIIGGRGTQTYRESADRDLSRSAYSYALPLPLHGFSPRLVPWRSFRHKALRWPKIVAEPSSGFLRMRVEDDRSQGYRCAYTVRGGAENASFVFDVSRMSTFVFWSDIGPEEIRGLLDIEGDVRSHRHKPGVRFDGIGNARACHVYEIEFERHLEIGVI